MKNATIEFIGAFFLTFVVAIAVGGGIAANLAPFAVFAVLMACIYAGGHHSGGAYNPVVVVMAWFRGKISAATMLGYWVAQMSAGIAAGLLAQTMPNLTMPLAAFVPDTRSAMIVEFLFTFLLCFVVLQVATTEKIKENPFYGVPIAMVVLAGALSVGTVSSAVFNPAVGAMLVTVGHFGLPTYFLYCGAQLAGAILASFLFKFTNAGE